ncbi:MAG: tRNA pseudouridine(55) synthase TruB [Acidobacteria bacterium]|nr:tRNA pseudouridine(55) synthase TruB [Acidobacteriota bacterium]
MNGLLIIDKPAGITSHDVVARCRRILKTKKIGHTRTLDPFATGVMVILVGKATRLAQFLDKDEKEYEAAVRFGFETVTGDVTGERRDSESGNSPFSFSQVQGVASEFTGEILQTPPMYSAKKVEGKKLYELARAGVEIERQAVTVTIHKLEMSEPAGDELKMVVACSAGTYIRTLAEDIARRAGSAAHLAELRRTRAGKFGIEKALTLEELEKVVAEDRLADHLIAMNEAVGHLPSVTLNAERAAKTKSGLSTRVDADSIPNRADVRIVDESGALLAIGTFDSDESRVQPRIVLV